MNGEAYGIDAPGFLFNLEGEMAMSWNNVVNLKKLEFKPEQTRESYHYETAPLSGKMGAKKLGFHAEVLPSKQFSCPYHFHHSEEELFVVLEGKAMLRQADQYREVTQGDLIFFPNSLEGAHQFYNHTDLPFRFLALSTKDEFEVCEYPDSKKIKVCKIKKVFQEGVDVDYWKDEANPGQFWPSKYLQNET